MFGDSVGGPHPPLLSPETGIHPLFGPRALAVAPPHERYQRADHPLVSGITTLQIQGDPQAGDVDDCGRLPLQEWDFLSRNGGGGGAAGRRASRPESGGGGMWQGGHGSAKSAAGERHRRRW